MQLEEITKPTRNAKRKKINIDSDGDEDFEP